MANSIHRAIARGLLEELRAPDGTSLRFKDAQGNRSPYRLHLVRMGKRTKDKLMAVHFRESGILIRTAKPYLVYDLEYENPNLIEQLQSILDGLEVD